MLGERLVLVGAGDFARELLWICGELPRDKRSWDRMCFVDDNLETARARMHHYGIDVPIISKVADFVPSEGDVLICSIGDPRAKLTACECLLAKGGRFINVIHPSVEIASRSTLGRGVIITRLSSISVDVSVGDFVTINSYTGLGHDAVVGDGCTISAHCDITGHAHLERGVFLGSHAAVMPGVRVGAFAKVGAGSVAFRKVKSGETVIGVPAKLMM